MSDAPLSTLDQWRERLSGYIAAEARILQSQEYIIGSRSTNGRSNKRADLAAVQAGIKECADQIALLEAAANPRARRTFRLRPI